MPYDNPQILREEQGNNAFAWGERAKKYGKSPTLTIPSLIEGGISGVQIGDEVVFEEIENGKLKSCVGLKNFVCIRKVGSDESSKMGVRGEGTVGVVMKTSESTSEASAERVGLPLETFGALVTGSRESVSERDSPSENDKKGKQQEIVIFDNHNHALYFWIDAVKKGTIDPGFTLIHIDEHSDLWENPNTLDLNKALQNEEYAWNFANRKCNVGNYIQPAIESGLVGKIIRIENESQIDTYMNFSSKNAQEISQEQEIRGSKDFSKGVYSTVNEGEKSEADKEVRSSSGISTVLNLDLDIFAPELDFIPEEKKIRIIRNLLEKVDYVTIATSPFFIDQGTAIQKLHHILESE